jgi:hypothetical protein
VVVVEAVLVEALLVRATVVVTAEAAVEAVVAGEAEAQVKVMAGA